jgi:hypothetical protein
MCSQLVRGCWRLHIAIVSRSKCSPATIEAHPLITQPNIKPGSQGFWYTRDEAKNQDLGLRERGTDAQLWTRYNMMQAFKTVRPGGLGRGEGMV